MYKADLKYSNVHSNYWQEKSSFPSEAIFTNIQNSINRHFYLVTMHASYSKSQYQSPIQYKADVSLEDQEKQEDLNK